MARTKKKELGPQDLAAFFESLTMLLAAGVPANECPNIIAGDMERGRLADACRDLECILDSGEVYVFSEAMEQSGSFPAYAVEMFRLGEESGRLESTSEQLGEYYRRQQTLNQSIRSAISGPVLLMIMMSVVLIFLISFVLPVFEDVFAMLDPGAELGMGNAFMAARIAMLVVGVLLVLVLLVLIIYLLPGGRRRLAKMAQGFPLTKRVHYAISASRLTGGLAMLLASGISTGEALEKAGALVDNKRIRSHLKAAKNLVAEGEDLGKALVEANVLEGFEAKILLSASRAGQTEMAMRNLSEIYTEEANNSIDRLLGMIEPALVGVLSVAIGVILLSVMLPLTSLLTAI